MGLELRQETGLKIDLEPYADRPWLEKRNCIKCRERTEEQMTKHRA